MTRPERPLAASALEAAVNLLADRVSDLTKAIKRNSRWTLVILLVVATFGWNQWQTHRADQRDRRQRTEILRVVRVLEDATTPGGTIYDRGLDNQRQAVEALLKCGRSYLENATHGTPIPESCP